MIAPPDNLPALPALDAWVLAGEVRAAAGYVSRRPPEARTWLLLQTHVGEGQLRVGETTASLAPRHLVLVRPDAPASDWSSAGGAWHFGWFRFRPRPEWLAWLDDWPAFAPGHASLTLDASGEASRTIVHRLADARDVSLGRHARRGALSLNALEQALLWCDALRAAPPPSDDRMSAVADWMCRNLDRPVTLEGLALLSGLSVSGLAHRFRAEIGAPPLQYLERQRMRRARELLALTGLSVREIAACIGFEDARYFTARFRKSTGQSPDSYRRQFALHE